MPQQPPQANRTRCRPPFRPKFGLSSRGGTIVIADTFPPAVVGLDPGHRGGAVRRAIIGDWGRNSAVVTYGANGRTCSASARRAQHQVRKSRL